MDNSTTKTGPKPGYRFTSKLKQRADEREVSLASLAQQVGVNPSTMTRYSLGQSTCREHIAKEIARLLAIRLSEIAIPPP